MPVGHLGSASGPGGPERLILRFDIRFKLLLNRNSAVKMPSLSPLDPGEPKRNPGESRGALKSRQIWMVSDVTA